MIDQEQVQEPIIAEEASGPRPSAAQKAIEADRAADVELERADAAKCIRDIGYLQCLLSSGEQLTIAERARLDECLAGHGDDTNRPSE